jgi:hypothetical protein
MNSRIILTVAWTLVIACSLPAAEEQSTPKETLKAFARATREADRQKLRACLHAADGNEARMADAMVDATTALARLRLAAIGKFGEARSRELNGGVPSEDEIRLMDAAAEKIDGDRATVTMKNGPRSGEMQLVRIDGVWKIAVGQGTAGKAPELIDAEITSLQKTAGVVGEVADEVAAGKYKTAREAAESLAVKAQRAGKATSQPAR